MTSYVGWRWVPENQKARMSLTFCLPEIWIQRHNQKIIPKPYFLQGFVEPLLFELGPGGHPLILRGGSKLVLWRVTATMVLWPHLLAKLLPLVTGAVAGARLSARPRGSP